MVKSNRYTPTNKAFRNHFQDFASTKTKKGHLNNSDESEGTKTVYGVLKKIDKTKLYDKGWLVETSDGKQYWCSYGDGVVCIPESTLSANYYVPKKTTEVEISIDEDNSIYTITRLKDPNKKPIALYNDTIEISTNTNTNSNKDVNAKVSISKNDINLVGQTIADSFKADSIEIKETVKANDMTSNTTTSDTVNANTVKVERLILNEEEVSVRFSNIEDTLASRNEEMDARFSEIEDRLKRLEDES